MNENPCRIKISIQTADKKWDHTIFSDYLPTIKEAFHFAKIVQHTFAFFKTVQQGVKSDADTETPRVSGMAPGEEIPFGIS